LDKNFVESCVKYVSLDCFFPEKNILLVAGLIVWWYCIQINICWVSR